jgi:hypothetical protein
LGVQGGHRCVDEPADTHVHGQRGPALSDNY